ncbi:hypothetical protein FBQ88_08265 [Gammaproteobacteria bacterium PRO2]|nr:hypothetical protein [Gammaproteobacteria bacterium]MDL1881010.1 hypothetical protein [Gammaproteobacteria bacterium PRO2]
MDTTRGRTMGSRRLSSLVGIAGMVLGACGQSAAPPAAEGVAQVTGVPASPHELPLRRGFYVSSDTACEQASNATLGLLHARGLNGSRTDCVFESAEMLGKARYRIVEQCTVIGSGERLRTSVIWEVLTPESFQRTEESGWQSRMRYCEQQALPEDWREIDLEADNHSG